ncbi:MAG: TIGR00282 family metallophosphoesterase [Desulfuromonadales bacterium]|nr:TIGR00282 family metallophosphoesterase [Desulfuromonadales bacterium]MDT8422562.1 TIGR00282 family metallophosphoesterase [Desulfuromonadales bacterium]
MKLLFVGDVVGRCGRHALTTQLDRLIDRHLIDLVVINGENAAAGFGMTVDVARELLKMSVDVVTSGNHVWDKRDIYPLLDSEPKLLRPANYPAGVPGRGAGIFHTNGGTAVGVLNLEGRVFMSPLDNPFLVADRLVDELRKTTSIILVDFHAEATSEKVALGFYLAGRVSAVVGTHTHVQTADERVLTGGTAYITDVGMTGSRDSIIGIRKELATERFLTQLPTRFEVAKKDPMINAVVIDIDDQNGRATTIMRINELVENN